MQAHAKVCEENKLEELEEKTIPIEIILCMVKGTSLKDHVRRLEEWGDLSR